MAANRLIDAEMDARNPRTASRAIPMGIMSRLEMLGLALAGFALLHVAAWQLNTPGTGAGAGGHGGGDVLLVYEAVYVERVTGSWGWRTASRRWADGLP